jgi:hypothetical protein
VRKFLIIFMLFSVSSCSSYYNSNSEKAYLNSNNGIALDVPRPLVDNNISHFYDLPAPIRPAEVAITPPL